MNTVLPTHRRVQLQVIALTAACVGLLFLDDRFTLPVSAIASVLGLVVAYSVGRAVHQRIDMMDGVIRQMEELAAHAAQATTQIKSISAVTSVAQSMLENAESTQRNNQIITERIGELVSRSQRIAEILEVIKDIANKSELLALNAALEGTKAGEAGRGFSLVANQMQRLAENVMGSVRDIKQLTVAIREATNASVLATEEGTKLTADTTRSAREIAHIVHEQQGGSVQSLAALADQLDTLLGQVRSGVHGRKAA